MTGDVGALRDRLLVLEHLAELLPDVTASALDSREAVSPGRRTRSTE